ncbi:hypothetical protein [Sulfitobacter sp. JB4-11]|uniref:hypothetical protein n=1 Tax=Sulfitobacter rhodophyticola TaxID=3238304 RepID=UPI0035186012
MTNDDFQRQVGALVAAFEKMPRAQRSHARTGVERVIQTLKDNGQPIPAPLRRIEARFGQDDEEDFFDNMPV